MNSYHLDMYKSCGDGKLHARSSVLPDMKITCFVHADGQRADVGDTSPSTAFSSYFLQ